MTGAEFHLQSLAFAMVVVSCVVFLCLVPAIFRFPEEFRPGLRSWIVGTALVTLTDVVFFTGLEFPYLDTTLMAVGGIGIAEWVYALRRIDGPSNRQRWPYAVVVVGTSLSALSPSYPMSAVMFSIAFGVLYFGAAWTARRIRDEGPSVGRSVLVVTFAVIGAVMLGRIVIFAALGGSGASPGFTTAARSLVFVVAAAGPFAGSLGFVMTCGERLGHRLLHLSLTDPLTGIANRRAFVDALERALSYAHRRALPVSVLVIDIDHFKGVNDAAGHAAGDRVLIEMAALLTKTVRSEDLVARLGGEEFGVVQSGADIAAAVAVAERLRSAVEEHPFTDDGREFKLTVSIGAAINADRSDAASDVLSRADRQLYEAKRRGRNRVAAG